MECITFPWRGTTKSFDVDRFGRGLLAMLDCGKSYANCLVRRDFARCKAEEATVGCKTDISAMDAVVLRCLRKLVLSRGAFTICIAKLTLRFENESTTG